MFIILKRKKYLFRKILESLQLIFSLVRRDYAVLYAGTSLGLAWLVIQYLFQIALFFLIFGVVLPSRQSMEIMGAGSERMDYLSFLLGGMSLWLPVSDMLIRSCGILTENRALIRRTSVGTQAFIWVPVFEGLLHYFILFAAVCMIGFIRNTLSLMFPLALLTGISVIMFLSGWVFILARIGVLLKDISPMMRLVLQIVFWCTPIVYAVSVKMIPYFSLNPFYIVVELHRNFLNHVPGDILGNIPLFNGLVIFLPLSAIAFYLSSRRLNTLIMDHL